MGGLGGSVVVGAILLAAVQGMTPVARAEGALAVGASGNFAKDGFAVGGAIDKATKQDAIDQALATCRKYEGAPKMAAICRIVATFRRECFAINFDPKPGTPGVGWAVGPTKAAAEERALAACQTTAGAARRKFCKLEQSFCDTHD
jgi:hypothetical protein